MFRALCLLTTILAVPFGLACMVAPEFVFGQFGMKLDAAAAGIARGYAATALGLGLTAFLMRDTKDRVAQGALIVGTLVFNVAELFAQVPLWYAGLANNSVWGTIAGHAAGTLLCVLALLKVRDASPPFRGPPADAAASGSIT